MNFFSASGGQASFHGDMDAEKIVDSIKRKCPAPLAANMTSQWQHSLVQQAANNVVALATTATCNRNRVCGS